MQLQLKNNPKNTSVPNGFIERCIGAPEKHIAAYLLGLMYSQRNQDVDFSIFCARLGMSEGETIEAFEYWQKKGFARIINSERFSIELGVYIEERRSEDVYTEKEFNKQLQAIFGARQLSPHEYIKFYDYIDVFGLTRPVVLILAEYCVMLRGKRVSITYIDKVAKTWAEDEQIDTKDKARAKVEAVQTAASGVTRVLSQLGIGRRATKDESALFAKWTSEWGFTLEAILTACANTTSAREPSMKYLDRILERLKDEGDTTSRKIIERTGVRDESAKNIGELLHLLGQTSLKPTFEYESLYQKWTSAYGYDMPVLTAAAKHAGAQGRAPLSSLDGILTDWYNNKIATKTQADKYIAAQQALDEKITAMFGEAGIAKQRILPAHRKTYQRWRSEWGLCEDAVLLAAEISSTRDHPYQYLSALMSGWHDAGVKTLADAQQQWQKNYGKPRKQGSAPANDRPTENYDHLAVDLFADEGA